MHSFNLLVTDISNKSSLILIYHCGMHSHVSTVHNAFINNII